MGIFNMFKRNGMQNANATREGVKVMTQTMSTFSAWGGDAFHNDLVRSIIRVKAVAVGKAIPKHIRRNSDKSLDVNPEPYIKELLLNPNPMMTMQQLLEKTMAKLELSNNAFIFILRDDNGYPTQLLPIDCVGVQPIYTANNHLYMRFNLEQGGIVEFDYSDVIHLRKDFYMDALFGTPNYIALQKLLEINHTMDEGIINSIKNSALIRWLLKFKSQLRPEDIKKQTQAFSDSFLNTSSESYGVAGVDQTTDAVQIKDDSKIPNADQMDRVSKRIMDYFNTNANIISGKYNEDEYTAFYETCIEPVVKQLSDEVTRKIFTRKQRSYGNEILFEAFDLSFSSMRTRLSLAQMVDRKAMTPNEWRSAMNLAPYAGGDEFILRLDTQSQKQSTYD